MAGGSSSVSRTNKTNTSQSAAHRGRNRERTEPMPGVVDLLGPANAAATDATEPSLDPLSAPRGPLAQGASQMELGRSLPLITVGSASLGKAAAPLAKGDLTSRL